MPLELSDVVRRGHLSLSQREDLDPMKAAIAEHQRGWIENELVKEPAHCPVCGRRTDLSKVPEIRVAIEKTIAYTREDREKGLKTILDFFAPKIAFKETQRGQHAWMVFCQNCTLADLHRQGNADRIDYYKRKPTRRRHGTVLHT